MKSVLGHKPNGQGCLRPESGPAQNNPANPVDPVK
jgi:hypothetical protein